MSFTKEGITLPGEAKDKCCWFVPLKPGIYIIGVFMCLWAFNAIRLALFAFDMMSVSGQWFIYGVGYAVSAAPIILGAWFFIKFFRNPDEKEARDGLSKACMMVILSSVILCGVAVVQFLLLTGFGFGNFLGAVISAAITAMVYFYYAGVCRRYAEEL